MIDTFKAQTGLEVNELTRTPAPATRSRRSRPTRTTRARRRRTSSTSACRSAPRPRPRACSRPTRSRRGTRSRPRSRMPTALWYGDYYGVLRVRGQHGRSSQRPEGLGRPAQGRVQGQDRPRRRPARVQPGHPGRLRRGPRQRRLARRRAAGPRLLQAAQRQGQPGPGVIANRGDRRQRRDPDHDPLDLQRAGRPRRHCRSGGPKIEVVVPTSGRFGGVYVQAISAYAPHPNAAKLWRSSCTPTRARTSG